MSKIKKEETVFIKKDSKKLFDLYKSWKKYDKLLREFKTRGSNIPEQLTEGIVGYLFGYKRIKGEAGDLQSKSGEIIEVKATSIEKDCTSFSPKKPEWDKIYFVDFYESKEKKEEGVFTIYDISKIDFDKLQITKEKTFKAQRKQGRRPRLSIKKLLKTHKPTVKKTISLKNIEKYFETKLRNTR